MNVVPQTERPPVQFLVRAHTGVAGSVPTLGTREATD